MKLLLVVDDPQAVIDRAVGLGARQVYAAESQHGWLLGRIEDPFGHHWEIGRPLIDGADSGRRVLEARVAQQGIRVNAVCPGAIDTPMMDATFERFPGFRETLTAYVPMGRMGGPEEVAARSPGCAPTRRRSSRARR